MKIAYLIPGTGVSGGIAVICQHVNRLLARGHDVWLVTQSGQTDIAWFPNQKTRVVTLEEYPQDTDILVATGWTTSFVVAKLPARQKFYFVQSDETRFHPQEPFDQGTNHQHLREARALISYSALLIFNRKARGSNGYIESFNWRLRDNG